MSNLGIAQSEITGSSGSGSGSTINFRGIWSVTTAYATNDVVTRKGSVYIAVQGNTGSDPYLDTTSTNWNLFTQGFNYAGTWSNAATYNFFDVVTFNNSFYLSVVPGEQSNTGHNPQTDTPSSPAPAFVQSVTASGTTNPLPSPSITFTTGHLVLVVVIVGNGSTQFATSVTDGLGNTYTRLPGTQATDGSLFGGTTTEIWYARNVTGGTTTVSAHATFGGFGDITVLEYKDFLTSSLVVDQTTSATGSGTHSVGPVTTTNANELIFTAFFEAVSGSTPSGYTSRSPVAGAVYDKFVSSVGSFSATTGGTGDYVASMATFVEQTPSSNWVLLDQGFNFTSAWNVGTAYNPYDVVTYQSSTYINILAVTGGAGPAVDTGHWALMAAAGQVAPRQTEIFTMPSASITNVSLTSNVVTLACVNTFTSQGEGTGQGQVNTIYITGLTGASFLNAQVLTIVTINGTTITANFTHADYASTPDSGTATLSIPINGVYWTTIPLGKTFALSYIQCLQANRIELYSTSAARTADASRPATTQPTQFTQHGVILDLNLDGVVASFTSWVLSPLAYGADLNVPATPSNNIEAALTNIGGAPTTNTFQITFTFTFEESGGVSSPNADQYVLGTADTVNLPSSVGNPTAYYSPDVAPVSAGSLDDEFNAASLSLSRWTWFNQGTDTATLGNSLLTINGQADAGVQVRGITQPVPGTPWTVVVKLNSLEQVQLLATAFLGVMLTDGSGKIITFLVAVRVSSTATTNPVWGYEVDEWTNFSTYNTTLFGVDGIDGIFPKWMKVQDDGVNLNFSISNNGSSYLSIFSVGRTAYLTAGPTLVGITASSNTSNAILIAAFDYFRRTQ